jgi:hypothetical protein
LPGLPWSFDGSTIELAIVVVHAALEPAPFRAGAAVFQQEVRAILVGRGLATARPMVVRDNILEGNVVLLHEDGGEHGGVLDGAGAVVALVLTHLDADGLAISRTMEVRMLALLGGGHVLDCDVVVDGEMPDEESNAVSISRFRGAEGAVLQGGGMALGPGGVVLRAVDGDVARGHGPDDLAADGALADHVHLEVDGAQHGRHRQAHRAGAGVAGNGPGGSDGIRPVAVRSSARRTNGAALGAAKCRDREEK